MEILTRHLLIKWQVGESLQKIFQLLYLIIMIGIFLYTTRY